MELLNTMKPFLKEAWQKAGFEQPTAIQQKAIPSISEGADIVAESPTGTGKTLAYLLPILHNIDPDKREIQAVILSPTRELAMQIHQVIQNFTLNSGIVSGAFIGGVDLKRQIDRLKKNPMIIVGTPGRINELIDKKKMKMHEVKTVVVDEVDQMVAQKLTYDVKMVIQSTLRDRQVLFFSATISDVVQDFAKKVMNAPTFIQVERERNNAVDHIYFVSERRDKVEVLRRIYRMDESMKALIFINDSFHIDELAAKFKYKKIPIGVLHSAANKKERAAAIQQFRSGKLTLLLATDIAARGMDIQGLTHVIHLDMPEKIEQYIHRSGRTGRMGAQGTVISLVTPTEEKTLLKYGKELGVAMTKKELYGGEIVDDRPNVRKSDDRERVTKRAPRPEHRQNKDGDGKKKSYSIGESKRAVIKGGAAPQKGGKGGTNQAPNGSNHATPRKKDRKR
ncbi:DNA/RNA helicase, superfamily II [Schinkia azotoformans MEV2011]|uniref:DNA/RNA helicase, superfamily II n=1 Tax=Schinkia azotoformans MEV2011 TaxID=1348973 RepID=A0A072NXK9_SCHAZ|nr:DEAD/DEAH box helicase [Schinkia azotoformans]KEF37975.1 DNA/RNA helicase, superfamily II [Schinkia azotoformans MEV2011]MEC1696332.1 DEAD/DEAH box helicase [Schinkia azotoformans]MEC1727290.1 DEAD/DEAH box helicase [Schinkia azotoformans]MEC1770786.1 DEAD/DEAH box helicase [Schinkia azotoformans]MEC1780850.1 DEAD/DEAH box helicase [Schinkia azotoformans]